VCGGADEDVSGVDGEVNRTKNPHLLPDNYPFGHLSKLKKYSII